MSQEKSFKKSLGIIVLILNFISLSLFSACQLGLGSAVDVTPPEMTVTEPWDGARVKSKFTMSGTWKDDGEIKSFNANIYSVKGNDAIYKFTVPVQMDKETWKCEIDPANESTLMKDGEYTVKFEITDTADHVNASNSVSFKIDNTKPLVFLTRPSTKETDSSSDSYGCEFSVKGEVLDDNNVSIEINIYDRATGELKASETLNNVKSFEKTLAVLGGEEDKDAFYKSIYGEVSDIAQASGKDFYCTIVAKDDAVTIPASSNNGNSTDIFYMESDLENLSNSFSHLEIYEILKGTYTASSNQNDINASVSGKAFGATQSDVTATLSTKMIGKATFSLDPRNNPSYLISGRSNLSQMADLNQDSAVFTNNSKATLNIMTGLDGYSIREDTVGISLVECDVKGNPVSGSSEITLLQAYCKGTGEVYKDAQGKPLVDLQSHKAKFKKSGSTISVDVVIGTKTTKELKVGKYYRVKMAGYDTNGREIRNFGNTDFAFKLKSANATPSLTITELARRTPAGDVKSSSTTSTVLGDGETLVIKGHASLEDLVPQVKFVYGLGTALSEEKILGTISADTFENGFVCNLPDELKNTEVKIRVIAINPEEEDQTSSKELDVSYDCLPPAFDNISISPIVTKNGTDYVNGTVTIKGAVEDKMNTVTEVYFKVNGGKQTKVEKLSAEGFKVDTTQYDDENGKGTATVTIFARDKAGNIGEETIKLNIDQSTDAPVIEFTNADENIADLEGIVTATSKNITNNIFQINGANNSITATISDDDGIKSVVIYKKKIDKEEFTSETVLNVSEKKDCKTTYQLKNLVSREQGEYDIYIVVTDKEGEETGYNSKTSKTFHAGVDEGAPNFIITTAQGLQAQNMDLKIIGTVVDGTDVAIRRYVYKEATTFDANERYFKYENSSYLEEDSSSWKSLPDGKHFIRVLDSYRPEPISVTVGDTSWEDLIPGTEIGTTGATVYYEATDVYGQTTGQNYLYTIDSYPPVFKITKVNENIEADVTNSAQKNIFVKNSSFVTIEGTVEDQFANDSSKSRGLDSFVYFKLSDTEILPIRDKNYYDITDWSQSKPIDSGSWKQTLDVSELGLSDGTKYTLYVAAKDAAGNISVAADNQSYAVNIIADATAPSFATPSYTIADESHTTEIIQIQNSNREADIKVKVTVTDPAESDKIASGIESVILMENSIEFPRDDYSCTKNDSEYTFTVNAQKLATGSHFLVIRATDKVGNKTDLNLVEIAVDVTPPKLTISGVTPSTSKEGDLSDYYNGKVTVKAVASDETNLAKVDWWIKEKPEVKDTFVYNESNATNKNIAFELDTYNKITKTSGTYTLKMQATDAGGNVSELAEQVLKIDQATDTPVIVFSNIDTSLNTLEKIKNATIAGNVNNIFGSVKDNQIKWNISDDDGIKSLVMKYRVAGSDGEYISENIISNGTSKSYKNNYVLSFNEAGLYEVIYEVADTLNETKTIGEGAEDKSAKVYGPFVIAIDDEEPKISLTTDSDILKQNSVIYTNKDINVTLTVSDDYGLDSLTYSESGSRTVSNGAVGLPATGTNTKVHTIAKTASSGKIKNVYKVLDTFGKQNTAVVEYVFDLDAPEVTITTPTLVNGFFDASKSFTVEGTATEPTAEYQSELSKVEYSLCKGTLTEYPDAVANIVKAWTEADGSAANWKVKFDSESVEEGEYTLFVRAKDKAGNTSEVQVVSFNADCNKPEVSVTKVNGKDGSDFEAYYTDSFSIEGTIDETYLDVSKTTVKVYKGSTDVSNKTEICTITKPTDADHTWKVEINKASDGANDGDYHVEVLAKDLFGKPNSGTKEAPVAWVSKTAKLDTVKPVISLDGFKFGNTAFTSLNEVADVWFKSNTLAIEGKYAETGSGIKEISYVVTGADGEVKEKGTITPSSVGSYNSTISNFIVSMKNKSNGGSTSDNPFTHNFLTLKAIDKAGNESIESTITVAVDQQGPTVGDANKIAVVSYKNTVGDTITENLSQGATKLVNGSFDVKVEIPVEDDFSTVDSVKLKIGDEYFTSDAISTTYDDETKTATVTIKKEKLSSNPVYIQATDKAGNQTTQLLFRFNVDNKAPNVGFTSHTNESSVNKTITLRGTVEDDQKLSYTYLEQRKEGDSNWTKIADTRESEVKDSVKKLNLSGSVWNFDIDTSDLTDKKTYAFRLTGVDTAANVSSEAEKKDAGGNIIHTPSINLKIDQDSDRPVIEFQNITKSGDIGQSSNVQVLVSDDDGVNGLKLYKATGDEVPSTASADWKEITLNNGAGNFSVDGGSNNIFFKVIDAKEGVFITKISETPTLELPKIKYSGNNEISDNNSAIVYIYDETAPVITARGFGFGVTTGAAVTAAEAGSGDNFSDLTADNADKLAGGKLRKYVSLSVTVNEDIELDSISVNGMSGVTFTLGEDTRGVKTYVSSAFDVSTYPTKDMELQLTVKDKSGRVASSNNSISLEVESGKPSISLIKVGGGDITSTVTASPKIEGTFSNEGPATVNPETFKLLVLDDTYYTTKNVVDESLVNKVLKGETLTAAETTAVANGNPLLQKANVNHAINATNSSWDLILNNTGSYKCLPASKEELTAKYSKVHNTGDTYELKVYAYVENTVGNAAIVPLTVSYNPFGNRPSSSVSYPLGTQAAAASSNGTIRISGTSAQGVANGTKAVKYVYLQFDLNHDGNFDSEDMKYFNGTNKVTGSTPYDVNIIYKDAYRTEPKVKEELNLETLDNAALTGDFWGIKTNGQPSSWYLSVNSSMEFQIAGVSSSKDDNTEFTVGVRSIAVSEDGVFGTPSEPQYFKLDTNIPVIGDKAESIVEFDDENKETATRKYVSDMFTKGVASLRISVEDATAVGNGGINKVMYYLSNTKQGLSASNCFKDSISLDGIAEENKITSGTDTFGYYIDIPLSTKTATGYSRESGELWVKVVVFKENDQSVYALYNVNFDNTAPTIDRFTLNSVEYADSDKKVVNSNGVFTLGGKITDYGAGFERAGFYFIRGDGKKYDKRIYNPMASNAPVKVYDKTSGKVVSAITANDFGVTSSSLHSTAQTMYGATQEVTISTDDSGVSTFTLAKADSNIKAGGLACVNGTFMLIKEKTAANVITLASTSAVNGTTEVFFPYMQIVDNTNTEKTDATGLNVTSGDDGDEMPESIIKSQSSWTWDATLQSANIPDGPGKLVVFLWDKAGNISAQSYECSVQNKAPRLVKLSLGTNLDGSVSAGKPTFSDNEFVSYNVLEQVGKQSTYIDMKTSSYKGKSFRVKDNLAVVAEFTGGNNVYKADKTEADGFAGQATDGLKLVFNKNPTTKDPNTGTGTALRVSDTSILESGNTVISTGNIGKTDEKNNNIWVYLIENDDIKADEGKTSLESSASELTNGIGSNKMSFTFWDKTEDTTQGTDSCYMHLQITDLIVDIEDKDAPSIWIKPFYWNSNSDCSAVIEDGDIKGHIDLGDTPKVSGLVKIRGSAYDNTKLGSIHFSDPSGNKKYEVGRYEDGEWSEVKVGWPDSWKKFEIIKDYGITQDGHTVDWQMTLDTTQFGVGTNKEITVKAVDAQNNEKSYPGSTVTSTTKTDLTAKYVMDFVPYIKGVRGTNRSRLGRYPVQAGQEIVIEGMNFAAGAKYIVNFYKTAEASKATRTKTATAGLVVKSGDDDSWEGTISTAGEIKIKTPKFSTYFEVAVTKAAVTTEAAVYVETSNNNNQNIKWNIEEGTLDRDGAPLATPGINQWNDDRYLSVWFNSNLSGSVSPWDGTVKKIKTSDLKDGVFYVNASGNSVDSQANSLDTWFGAYSSPNMMIYDEMGNGAMSYHRTLYKDSQAAFVSPVETMDMTIIGGIPWYVFNDNYVGGSSANSWGAGLIVAREGYSFPKTAYNGTNSPTEGENFNIIERQGNGQPSDGRKPETGYDSVLSQFKNPRITGWYDPTSVTMNNGNGSQTYPGTNYVYVSYYDSFSHCLKYAAFKEAWDKADGRGEKWGNVNGTKNFTSLTRAADNMTKPSTVVAGVDRLYTAYDFSTTNGEDCGEWSDIMIDPSDHFPVIIYYNKTKGTLEVAHGKSATPSTANYKTASGAFTDTTASGWTKTTGITPVRGNDFGRYVSAEIDKNGNIHATAQDFTTGALYYVFLKKSGTSYVASYHAVDAEVSSAIWTDIQLANDTNSNENWYEYQPVISYINQARKTPKVAYVESATHGTTTSYFFEAISDANKYEAKEMKTSVLADVYETKRSGVKSKIGIAFNSDVLAVDFLRGEQ